MAYTERVILRLTKQQFDILTDLASAQKKTISEMIRLLIEKADDL